MRANLDWYKKSECQQVPLDMRGKNTSGPGPSIHVSVHIWCRGCALSGLGISHDFWTKSDFLSSCQHGPSSVRAQRYGGALDRALRLFDGDAGASTIHNMGISRMHYEYVRMDGVGRA